MKALNQIPVHNAHELVAGGNTARIALYGQEYELRITRSGKLILTK
ncbi:hemin uptake protein HemP [Aliiroseovarius sediminis]|nr:hemin uptake protein HemP [uncultured Aliiroseovarius sp.]MCI2395961.1 hemin uptake protein HemP [Aliiroseovarius sediminis]